MPGKSQEQRTIEVRMLDNTVGEGVATGNNAAWLCGCGYKLPLIGTSFFGPRPVVCGKCAKEYMVEGNKQRVDRVREISPEG